MSQPILYSASWCPYCVTLKKFLDKLGVTYILKDVDDPAIRQEMNDATNGNQTIPVLRVGDRFEVNPSAATVKQMLKQD